MDRCTAFAVLGRLRHVSVIMSRTGFHCSKLVPGNERLGIIWARHVRTAISPAGAEHRKTPERTARSGALSRAPRTLYHALGIPYSVLWLLVFTLYMPSVLAHKSSELCRAYKYKHNLSQTLSSDIMAASQGRAPSETFDGSTLYGGTVAGDRERPVNPTGKAPGPGPGKGRGGSYDAPGGRKRADAGDQDITASTVDDLPFVDAEQYLSTKRPFCVRLDPDRGGVVGALRQLDEELRSVGMPYSIRRLY